MYHDATTKQSGGLYAGLKSQSDPLYESVGAQGQY